MVCETKCSLNPNKLALIKSIRKLFVLETVSYLVTYYTLYEARQPQCQCWYANARESKHRSYHR